MKYLWLVVALLALPALAQTTFSPTWTWKAPTQCSDGTPVTPTTGASNCTITKYTLYTGLQGQTLKAWGSVGPTILSLQTPNTPAGIWCGQVTASSVTGEGAPSSQACIPLTNSVTPGSPIAPAAHLSTASTIAYMLVPGADTYAVLIVGTVPTGIACDPTHGVLLGTVPYYVIPRASVTLTAPFKAIPALLGSCT